MVDWGIRPVIARKPLSLPPTRSVPPRSWGTVDHLFFVPIALNLTVDPPILSFADIPERQSQLKVNLINDLRKETVLWIEVNFCGRCGIRALLTQ